MMIVCESASGMMIDGARREETNNVDLQCSVSHCCLMFSHNISLFLPFHLLLTKRYPLLPKSVDNIC